MESIEHGHESGAAHPRRRIVVVGLIAAALLLGALAWVIDAQWRQRTTDELTRAFDETVTAIESGERRVNSVLEYTVPDDAPSTQEDAARTAAIQATATISAARDRIDAIVIPPWHDELLTARKEADTWLALRATGITSLANQGRAIYPPQGELDDARAALVGAFSALR